MNKEKWLQVVYFVIDVAVWAFIIWSLERRAKRAVQEGVYQALVSYYENKVKPRATM